MTIYNVRDYALPVAEPKRGGGGRAALIGVVGVAMGLVLGLGTGLGAGLNAVGTLGTTYTTKARATLSRVEARDRWVACTVGGEYDDAPGPEELEWWLARMQARYAEPKWGTP